MKKILLTFSLLFLCITISFGQTLKGSDKQSVNIDGKNSTVTLDTFAAFYTKDLLKQVTSNTDLYVRNNVFYSTFPTKTTSPEFDFVYAAGQGNFTDENTWKWRYRMNNYSVLGQSTPDNKLVEGDPVSTFGNVDKPLIIEFWTDADSFELGVKNNLEILSVSVLDSVYSFTSNPIANGSFAFYKLPIPYKEKGMRLVRLYAKNIYFRGIGIDASKFFIQKPTFEIKQKIAVFGDSFVRGTGYVPFPFISMLRQQNPAIDFLNFGGGATGYIDKGQSNQENIPNRLIPDISRFDNVNAAWFLAGLNDSDESYYKDVADSLRSIKSKLNSLDIEMYIATPFSRGSDSTKTESLLNIRDSVLQFVSDSNIYFLGDFTNLDFFAADGTHPDFWGHSKIANQLNNRVFKYNVDYKPFVNAILSYTPSDENDLQNEVIYAPLNSTWIQKDGLTVYLYTKYDATTLHRIAFASF